MRNRLLRLVDTIYLIVVNPCRPITRAGCASLPQVGVTRGGEVQLAQDVEGARVALEKPGGVQSDCPEDNHMEPQCSVARPNQGSS